MSVSITITLRGTKIAKRVIYILVSRNNMHFFRTLETKISVQFYQNYLEAVGTHPVAEQKFDFFSGAAVVTCGRVEWLPRIRSKKFLSSSKKEKFGSRSRKNWLILWLWRLQDLRWPFRSPVGYQILQIPFREGGICRLIWVQNFGLCERWSVSVDQF